jgi:hypothetical protein
MSKELKNITEAVMNKIHDGEIKMRPKVYFIIGSLLTFLGLVASMLISVFLVGLMRFSMRTHGPMGEYRLDQMLSSFPWWAVVVAILGLVTGIWLLRRYNFSYKINFKVIVISFVVAIIVAGWVIDMTGLNDILFRQGSKRGIMRQYFQENNIQPGQGRGAKGNNLDISR